MNAFHTVRYQKAQENLVEIWARACQDLETFDVGIEPREYCIVAVVAVGGKGLL
ncbi:hypothetical protein M378DRAFT_154780 [Amanita muscaria Koide BX008]|uniref:Uncharacterized protein n=1 Tax=Amanita muscaria (strain Koide BX008) TaxID=946122 RepID=A0A0C2T5P1_AMAMK|nr:hypothetical protein M378DRAFT_154780 [Amanita muscaria Koide BX008]